MSANSYPLYYFGPSITDDGRWLVFHSERSGSVQLYRLDLRDGVISRLTAGTTVNAGWAIWCEYRLNGIFNHLSSLDPTTGDVYYVDQEDIRCVNVRTMSGRSVAHLPGRIPLGQGHVSPDGRLLAFVDADKRTFEVAFSWYDQRESSGSLVLGDDEVWRARVPTRIGLADTQTGALETVIELDFHVHHLLFLDSSTLLVNHPRGKAGMWTISVDGRHQRELRPGDAHGFVNHQILAPGSLLYETFSGGDAYTGDCWFGRYDLLADTWAEWLLPSGVGYVHTGNDPEGDFYFVEGSGDRHALYRVLPRGDSAVADVEVLHRLNDGSERYSGQRYHAHPFLSPDRTRLFFTDVIDGYSQICSIDVADITASNSTATQLHR